MADSVRQRRLDQLMAAYIAGRSLTIAVAIDNGAGVIRLEAGLWPGPIPAEGERGEEAFVFTKSAHAELVVAQCSSTSSIDALKIDFEIAAAAVGATWEQPVKVLAAAADEIRELETQLDAWNKSGGLRTMNAAYKQYRALAVATAAPALSYSDYLHAYKVKVAHLVGQNVARGLPKHTGILALVPDPLPSVPWRK
ncbi:hypothetical protein [Bradyrhizobium sp. CCBAU 51753]|uniref:hypothetical protein n=1 Tax=Bradyrhizobium sp. CCBAU 51753 TaxID=1325100 RepID=UPI0018C08081|nr:hypothetical protein [Bradyrhizobium sp. CCBAU 51753]QOZ25305.1 hypothetical protein XH93_18190 [Bradyrhizobium sp. CCBAU 51753]